MPNKLKYSPEIHVKIVAAIRGGATQRAAAQAFGVTPETVSHWKSQYPAFCEDVKRAEAEAQVLAEGNLYDLGRNGNVRALIHILKRRYPAKWGDKPQTNDSEQWPNTIGGWVAKREEFEAKYRKWLAKYGVQDGPETAAA